MAESEGDGSLELVRLEAGLPHEDTSILVPFEQLLGYVLTVLLPDELERFVDDRLRAVLEDLPLVRLLLLLLPLRSISRNALPHRLHIFNERFVPILKTFAHCCELPIDSPLFLY